MMTYCPDIPSIFKRALVAICALGIGTAQGAFAKVPGDTYCFYKTCHRVKTLAETRALIGREHTLPASFYDACSSDSYNPCGLTSSGEVFRPNDADNAASPIYPDGTTLLVWAPSTKQAAVLRVNNAGPYWGDRKLDVSRAAAEKLGFKGSGTANLKARVLSVPTRGEATYRYKRHYQPVAGHIGKFASLDAAALAVNAMGSSPLLAQDEEYMLLAIMRPSLKAWPVVGQTIVQAAVARSKAMPWPVLAHVQPKLMPPVGIAKTVAIKWPVVAQMQAKMTSPVSVTRTAKLVWPVVNAKPAKSGVAVKAVKEPVVAAFEKAARTPRRAETYAQQIAKAKVRGTVMAVAAPSTVTKKVAATTLPRIKPSRGLAQALKAEDAANRIKSAKSRDARQISPPQKRQPDKAVDAKKRVVKISWADPSFGLANIKNRITGRSPKLPSQYAPKETERSLKKPLNGPRLIQKAVA
jgi:rare lipoprotein A